MARRFIFLFCAAALAFALASCSSSSDGPSSVSGDPTVDSTSPADGATDVGLVKRVEIEFTEAMDPTTVDETTLTVAERSIYGFVEYDEATDTATFTPDTLYAPNSWFDVTVSGRIKDLDGDSLGQDETSSFQTGAFDCAHLTDHAEPNNSIAEATPIEIGRTYRSLTGCETDTDLFEFTIDDTLKVFPLAEFKRANEWCYVHMKRYTGEDYGFMGGNVEAGDFVGGIYTLMPGTYYVEVADDGGGFEEWILYDLTVTTGDPCNDDAYEDNDFFDEASPITPGLHEDLRGCRVDSDYYSFHVDAGQTITMTVDAHTGGTTTRQYRIFGPSENQLTYYWDTGNPVTLDVVAAQSGTHYVCVRYWSDDVIYDMNVTVTD